MVLTMMNKFSLQRRKLLKFSLIGGLGIFFSGHWLSASGQSSSLINAAKDGLMPPDDNGVRLPAGFKSRIVAQSGQNISNYLWHAAPDGGATFATQDDGWIYVSNSELDDNQGGVGALRFDSSGEVIDAYPILTGTTRNCAGGHTPWQTWLSCEEFDQGQVWECDPFNRQPSRLRPALGTFSHEAVAFDTKHKQLYLTEDKPDGCLYRFSARGVDANGNPDLDDGILEVAEVVDGRIGSVIWHPIPDPQAHSKPTRRQISSSSHFDGGEGIWFHEGIIYFTTKGDDRIWSYNTSNNNLSIVYNAAVYFRPVLTGVDNITVNTAGELLVAEDNGNMQIVIVTRNTIRPLLQIVGQDRSEITGPAFSPDGKRLYFSSQRGTSGRSEDGITYEITGPF